MDIVNFGQLKETIETLKAKRPGCTFACNLVSPPGTRDVTCTVASIPTDGSGTISGHATAPLIGDAITQAVEDYIIKGG